MATSCTLLYNGYTVQMAHLRLHVVVWSLTMPDYFHSRLRFLPRNRAVW
jgi:hypothetical protein